MELYAVDLALSQDDVSRLSSLLAPDELRHAANMRVEASRRRFLVARAALRILLSRELGCAARDVAFDRGRHGKPSVPGSPVTFNVSHSAELALIAVASMRAVGVDVERVRPRPNALRVAERYFTAAEAAAIQSAPAGDQPTLFYRHWVAKEAFLKATGLGIAGAVDSFEVSLDPPRIVSVGGDEREGRRWSLRMLEVGDGYAAALVAEGSPTPTLPQRFEPLAGVG